MARAITVDFLGNDKTLGRTIAGVDGKTGKLGSTMKKVGLIAGGLLAGAAVVGTKALFDMGKAAAEDQKSQALLANTLKNTAGATDEKVAAVERWISAQGKALGVTDDELRPALQRLAEATGDVGEAQQLASLAMDVSAGTGKSLKTVSEALMKAQNGQISGLSRLGIETKNAAGETLTFEQATKKMADQFGGSAATAADTLAGKQARLKLMLDETKEAIGAKLLPIALKFSTWMLNKGIPAVEAFAKWLGDKLGPIFETVGDIWRHVTLAMSGDGNKTVGQIRQVLGDLADTFRSVVSIVQTLWSKFGGILTDQTKSTFKNIWQIVRGAFQVIRGIFKVISSLLKGDWKGVWKGLQDIVKGAWKIIGGVVKLALNTLKNLFRLAGTALKGIMGGIWSGITTLVAKGIGKLVDAIRAIPGKIRNLGSAFKDAGKWILEKLIDGLTSVGGFVGDIAKGVKDAVVGAINGVIRAMNNAIPDKISLTGLPDIDLPNDPIPQINLARGGIIRHRPGGVIARIAEAGHDEAVIPLSGPHAPKLSGGGGTTIIVQGAMDPMAVAKQIEQLLIKYTRITGRPLQVVTR